MPGGPGIRSFKRSTLRRSRGPSGHATRKALSTLRAGSCSARNSAHVGGMKPYSRRKSLRATWARRRDERPAGGGRMSRLRGKREDSARGGFRVDADRQVASAEVPDAL